MGDAQSAGMIEIRSMAEQRGIDVRLNGAAAMWLRARTFRWLGRLSVSWAQIQNAPTGWRRVSEIETLKTEKSRDFRRKMSVRGRILHCRIGGGAL